MTSIDDLASLLETFCPMFMLVDRDGVITHVGPTLQKLRPDQQIVGQKFQSFFDMMRPGSDISFSELIEQPTTKLQLRLRDAPQTVLKGIVAPLNDREGAVVNLSFGISILDAVQDYALTSADFSGTDFAIELLYLVEAKSAAMEASRSLNLRLQGAIQDAEEQASTDVLTGLKNRRAMEHRMEHLISRNSPFALMHLDLDFFKSVNDRLGHAAGDHVLKEAASIMLEETRTEDVVARIGGDEFVIIFKNLQDKGMLDRIALRLIKRLQEPIPFEGDYCNVSASVGTALSSQIPKLNVAEMLHASDLALYGAKRGGRANHQFYCSMKEPREKAESAKFRRSV